MPNKPPTYTQLLRAHGGAVRYDPRPPNTFTASRQWRRLRHMVLNEHPTCQYPGCTLAATDVHHIIDRADRPDLAFDAGNLEALCHGHHSQETRRRRGRREQVDEGDKGNGVGGDNLYPISGVARCPPNTQFFKDKENEIE